MAADAPPSVVIQQGNVTVVLEESASQLSQPSDFTLASVPACAALLIAGSIARRRSRNPEKQAHRRLRRILDPALLFASTFTVWLVATQLRSPAGDGSLLIVAFLALIIVAAMAIASFGILDVRLFRFRPAQTRRWLLAALLGFPGITELLLGAVLLSAGDLTRLLDPVQLPIAVMAAAAGLIWWSHLPGPRHDLARLFD